jgi:hypothetical protein
MQKQKVEILGYYLKFGTGRIQLFWKEELIFFLLKVTFTLLSKRKINKVMAIGPSSFYKQKIIHFTQKRAFFIDFLICKLVTY